MNRLYFGDCLDVMREDIPSESVDLIYLDPPFNSKRLYNAFIGGAQWVAFDDTWRWHEAIDDFDQVASQPRYKGIMEGLRLMLGEGSQVAYLSYMANRLLECHRVLKPTGSIYLHCDPTMSHYLKAVMDGIFGHGNFRNEVIWRRTGTHNATRAYGSIHDALLFYSKTDTYTFNIVRRPYMNGHVQSRYRETPDGRFTFSSGGNVLSGAGISQGDSGKSWRGFDPTAKKRHWAVPRFYEQQMPDDYKNWLPTEKLEALYQSGLITISPGAVWPTMVRYLDERDGMPVADIWAYQPYTEGTVHGTDLGIDADVAWMGPTHPQRLGYPTQKPVTLLERVIEASSRPGDVVFDPFCGCGTAIHAAQNLGRRWIGVDICVNACKVVEQRLKGHFDSIWDEIEFIGFPKTRDDAQTLADIDKFRFERWAAALVDGMEPNIRQRGDRGIDGWGRIPIRKGQFIDLVSQVKGGQYQPRRRSGVQRGAATGWGGLGDIHLFRGQGDDGDAECRREHWPLHGGSCCPDLHRRGLLRRPEATNTRRCLAATFPGGTT